MVFKILLRLISENLNLVQGLLFFFIVFSVKNYFIAGLVESQVGVKKSKKLTHLMLLTYFFTFVMSYQQVYEIYGWGPLLQVLDLILILIKIIIHTWFRV